MKSFDFAMRWIDFLIELNSIPSKERDRVAKLMRKDLMEIINDKHLLQYDAKPPPLTKEQE